MPLISLFTSTFKPLGNSFKDRKPNIPLNDFNYVIIPNNDLVYVIVPNNDFTYTLIPTNDVSYAIIPDGNLEYTLIPNNDINCIILPDNDLDNVIIPDNDIISTLIPNNDVTYTLIPNTDLTYTLIPNNDIEYTVLKPPAVFYGEITLGEDSVEGTCNCPEFECPRFYVTGDGPTFCDSNIFVITGGGTFFSGWGTIVYNGYYKTVNMDGSNVATYRTDCGSCPITPTPTPTPTPSVTPTMSETPTQTPTMSVTPTSTITQTMTPTPTKSAPVPGQFIYVAQAGILWNSYGGNYLSFGRSQDGTNRTPLAGWYFKDSNNVVRRLLNSPLWFSGGNPSPYPNGNGWMAVANGSFSISASVTTITFYENIPT
jgi:hypothetical protein